MAAWYAARTCSRCCCKCCVPSCWAWCSGSSTAIPRLHRRQCLLRWIVARLLLRHVHAGGRQVRHVELAHRAAVRLVPGHLRRHHLRAGCGQLRRTRPLLGGAGLHGDLVHLRLRAHRPHGLVRVRNRARPAQCARRAGLRRRHGGAHQRRRGRPGRRLCDRQARGLRPRSHAAAQPAHDLRRRRAAVGGLVRLQRRLGPGRQRKRHAGLLQHHDRDRRRRAGLADHRMEHQGKPSMLGAASGAVAGLVGITPAAGLVVPQARWSSA